MRIIDRRGVLIKLKRRCLGTSQLRVAADMGVSPSYLSDVMTGHREPGPKILTALGLERVIRYRPISDERSI